MRKITWYEQLNYIYNPFTIKPGFFNDEVIGYDKEIETLVEWVHQGKVAFLQGEYGQGKTTILKYLINEFKDQRDVIYISRNRSDRAMNYKDLLTGAKGTFGKLFGIKAKNAFLIVDETEKINAKDCEQIIHYLDTGHFHAALFIDKSLKESRISPELKKRIGKNIMQLKSLHEKDAVALVRSRLDGNEKLISDANIKKVYSRLPEKSTRSFLLCMEEVCRNAIEHGRDSVNIDDLKVLS
jgi:predicted AAA+ superfamily ATPase